jgi:hypothetical protein
LTVGYYRERFKVWQVGLYFFLIYLAVTDFHPQWFLWLTPFVVIDLLDNHFRYWQGWCLASIGWLLIVLTFEASLNMGIFIPIHPALVYARNLSFYLKSHYDPLLFRHIIRSMITGVFIFRLIAREKRE